VNQQSSLESVSCGLDLANLCHFLHSAKFSAPGPAPEVEELEEALHAVLPRAVLPRIETISVRSRPL